MKARGFRGTPSDLEALLAQRGASLRAQQVIQKAAIDAFVPQETAAQRVRRRLAEEAEAYAPKLRRVR